jgi:hypothetical protein
VSRLRNEGCRGPIRDRPYRAVPLPIRAPSGTGPTIFKTPGALGRLGSAPTPATCRPAVRARASLRAQRTMGRSRGLVRPRPHRSGRAGGAAAPRHRRLRRGGHAPAARCARRPRARAGTARSRPPPVRGPWDDGMASSCRADGERARGVIAAGAPYALPARRALAVSTDRRPPVASGVPPHEVDRGSESSDRRRDARTRRRTRRWLAHPEGRGQGCPNRPCSSLTRAYWRLPWQTTAPTATLHVGACAVRIGLRPS